MNLLKALAENYFSKNGFVTQSRIFYFLAFILYFKKVMDTWHDPANRDTHGDLAQNKEAKIVPLDNLHNLTMANGSIRDDPKISIMIATRDKADYVDQCVNSIFSKSRYENFEIILIDNDSHELATQAILDKWRQKEPGRFTTHRMDTPFNFSILNNQAVSYANGSLLLFVNNDIEVISPDWLGEMAANSLRPKIGAVGAMLLFPNRTIQHAGITFDDQNNPVHAFYRLPSGLSNSIGMLASPNDFPAVTAACMMTRKDLFLSLGGFDENLAVSYGDVDYCLRLKQSGYRTILLPQVRLYHHESISRGYENNREKQERLAQEKKYLLNQHPELIHR